MVYIYMVYMVSEHWYIYIIYIYIYIFITYGTIPCVVADGLYQSYNGIYRFGWSSISEPSINGPNSSYMEPYGAHPC